MSLYSETELWFENFADLDKHCLQFCMVPFLKGEAEKGKGKKKKGINHEVHFEDSSS